MASTINHGTDETIDFIATWLAFDPDDVFEESETPDTITAEEALSYLATLEI